MKWFKVIKGKAGKIYPSYDELISNFTTTKDGISTIDDSNIYACEDSETPQVWYDERFGAEAVVKQQKAHKIEQLQSIFANLTIQIKAIAIDKYTATKKLDKNLRGYLPQW